MPEQERPDKLQLERIVRAVNRDFPELEIFPKYVIWAMARTWGIAQTYNVTAEQFTQDMVKPMGTQALAYVSYRILQNGPK